MSEQAPPHLTPHRRRPPWLLAVFALLWLTSLARAAAPGIVIDDFHVELQEGVYFLDADIDYRLSEEAVEALEQGVPLVFELQLEVLQLHDWWLDDELAVLSQRYQLRYHALSRRYVLTNVNTGYSRSYADRYSALAALGEVEELPVIDRRLLDDDEDYELRLRARLDVFALPLPLRTLAMVSPDWRLTSDWYSWPLSD